MRDGAGILPVILKNNKIHFLFGRENSSKLWSDFGGARDNNEGILSCAVREGYEETGGLIGNATEIEQAVRLRCITTIELDNYVSYLYTPIGLTSSYSDSICLMFDRAHNFALDQMPHVVEEPNGLFEKDTIKWFSVKEAHDLITEFRPFFRILIRRIFNMETYLTEKLSMIERG